MTTEPFSIFSTINTTTTINAPVATVWPVVRAMDQWGSFQDIFIATFKDGNQTVEVGQKIFIESDYFVLDVTTIEQYNELIEESRLCWTLRGAQVLGLGSPSFPVPSFVLRTARCIELFDDGTGAGTIVHNWISFAGLIWPLVCLFVGGITKIRFNDFNAALAAQF